MFTLTALPYRFRALTARAGRAWRYLRGTWTADDANSMEYDACQVTGNWALESLDANSTAEVAADMYGAHPKMADWAHEAAARVASKWSSSGDMASAAQDWALELIVEYAAQEGVTLTANDE